MARKLEDILANEKPAVVAKAQKAATEILLNIHLAELREHMKLTQRDIAETLGVKQPTVSDMEKPGRDLKLSSLKRYVEASGGKLSVDIELPDGTHYGFNVWYDRRCTPSLYFKLEQRLQTLANDLDEIRDSVISGTNNQYHRLAGEQLVQQLCNMCIGIAKHRCKQLNFPAPENAYKAFERLAETDTEAVKKPLTGNKS